MKHVVRFFRDMRYDEDDKADYSHFQESLFESSAENN